MDLQTAVQTVIAKYADFTGRARRSEYWYWSLATFLVSVVLQVLNQASVLFNILGFVFALAVIVPSIAVGVRRLHDIDRAGAWLLLVLVPFGVFVVLFWLVQDSQPGANQYGPSPKALAPGGY